MKSRLMKKYDVRRRKARGLTRKDFALSYDYEP